MRIAIVVASSLLDAMPALAQRDMGGMGPGGSMSLGESALMGGGGAATAGSAGEAYIPRRSEGVDPALLAACPQGVTRTVHRQQICDRALAAANKARSR